MQKIALFLAKQLIFWTLDRSLKRVLPRLFKRLDQDLPILLYNRVGNQKVRALIGMAIKQTTGLRATDEMVEAVTLLYDPREGANQVSQ